MKLVFASNNPHKLTEMQSMLGDKVELIAQSEFNVPEADETGLTYVENALIKARNACEYTDLPVLADDSGVCVPALNGEPGIYSARYGGPELSMPERRALLLKNFANSGSTDHRLYFYCALVVLHSVKDPTPIIALGKWEGELTLTEQGDNGFGYDPVFYDTEHQMTAAQLDPAIKNQISHRARAVQQLRKYYDEL